MRGMNEFEFPKRGRGPRDQHDHEHGGHGGPGGPWWPWWPRRPRWPSRRQGPWFGEGGPGPGFGPGFGPGRRGGRGRARRGDVRSAIPVAAGGRPGQRLRPHEGHRGALGRHLAPQPRLGLPDLQQLTDEGPPRGGHQRRARGAPAHRRRTQPRRGAPGGAGRRLGATRRERRRARGLPAVHAQVGRRAQSSSPATVRRSSARPRPPRWMPSARSCICSSPRTDPHP